jgi:hypothetical protein
MVGSSTFLVFNSWSNFRKNSTRFQFTDCCSQSRPNRRRYQILLFGGNVVGLSIATRYGTSKCYAPTRNRITIIKSFLWWLLIGIALLRKNLNQIDVLADFSSLWTSYENCQLRLTQPHHWGRLLFHCPKTLQVVLLFKTFLPYRFKQVFPWLAADSPSLPTLIEQEYMNPSQLWRSPW